MQSLSVAVVVLGIFALAGLILMLLIRSWASVDHTARVTDYRMTARKGAYDVTSKEDSKKIANKTLKLRVGDTLRITLDGANYPLQIWPDAKRIYLDSEALSKKITSGRLNFRPERPGTYAYVCTTRPSMRGLIEVH